MRRNLTISFGDGFIRWMDDERDESRGAFLEAVCQHDLGWEAMVPSSGGSPGVDRKMEGSRELPSLRSARQVLEEQRQSEAGEV